MKKLTTSFCTFIITILMIFGSINQSFSQIGDGTNFDFSMSDFTYWKGYQAKSTSDASTIKFNGWTSFANPSECIWNGDTCFIINKNYSEYDFNVGATKLIKIPTYFGFNRSVKINVQKSGANANYLSYDMLVSDKNSLVTFNFSMVLEAPGHSGYQNPFFQLEIFELDDNDNEIARLDPTTYYEVVGQLPKPDGWSEFTVGSSDGIWQNWKQVSFDLASFRSKRIRMKVLVTGCSPTAHWAYGYFVGKVGPSAVQVNSCYKSDTIAKLIAPSGFAKYEWFKNPDDLPLSQLSTIATGTPLATSSVVGTVPAKNSFLVKQSTLDAHGEDYFVRVTSQTSTATPGYVSYIKVKAYNSKPKAKFHKQKSDSLIAKFYNATEFPINDPSALIEYFWDFGDGSDILKYNSQTDTTDENIHPTHKFPEEGNYKITLTSKYNGCATTYDTTILIKFVGLEDIESDVSLSLYPNPATNQTTVKVSGVNGDAKVLVVDEQGRVIETINAIPSNGTIETKIDLSKYSSGIYFVKVIGEKIQKTEKLIIQ